MQVSKLSCRNILIFSCKKHKDSDLAIQIGGKTKMAGKSGLVGRRKAVSITRVVEKEVPGSDE